MATGDTLAVFAPLSYEPPASAYATVDTRNGHPVLDFDAATQESAIWTGRMPKHYGGGNLAVHVTWAATSATTGTIGWGVTFEKIEDGVLDIDADGWATEQIITAVTVPATSGITDQTSVTCTAGAAGTDAVAAGDLFRLRLRRDVANDTATGDAEVLGVEIREA